MYLSHCQLLQWQYRINIFAATYHGVPDTFGGAKGRSGLGSTVLGNKGGSARDQKSEDRSKLGHGEGNFKEYNWIATVTAN